MVPARFCLGLLPSLCNSKDIYFLLVQAAVCHTQMIRPQSDTAWAKREPKLFFNYECYIHHFVLENSKPSHISGCCVVCVVFPLRATSHVSYPLLKGYFRIVLGTFPYMAVVARSNKSNLFGGWGSLFSWTGITLINNRLYQRPAHHFPPVTLVAINTLHLA